MTIIADVICSSRLQLSRAADQSGTMIFTRGIKESQSGSLTLMLGQEKNGDWWSSMLVLSRETMTVCKNLIFCEMTIVG